MRTADVAPLPKFLGIVVEGLIRTHAFQDMPTELFGREAVVEEVMETIEYYGIGDSYSNIPNHLLNVLSFRKDLAPLFFPELKLIISRYKDNCRMSDVIMGTAPRKLRIGV